MTQIIVFASEKAYLCVVMAENYTYVPGAQYPFQYKYEHMAVTTDCIIFTYEDRNLKVLLIRRGLDPFKGEWVVKGPVQTTIKRDIAFTDFSLDHTHFEHKGKHYFLWAQKTNNISDIFIAQLSDPWTLCTPAVRLSHPEYNWELHGFPVDEGPGIIKHGDKIFLTFSGSGTDALYCVGLLYADADADLLDPTSWTKVPYPVFQSSTATGQFGLGHNSFTKSDDDSEDFIIYHGRQEARYLVEEDYQPLYDAGRNATVGKIYWNKEGFPDFSVPSASIAGTPEALQVAAKVTVI